MKQLEELRQAFDNLDHVTVGLFKHKAGGSNHRIIEHKNKRIKCVVLGGTNFHTFHTDADNGKMFLFGDNKTLADMLKEPLVFAKLMEEFDK